MEQEITLQELLDNTDPSNIWLSSDWHLFKSRRKKEKNEVNTQEIISYCKKTFKPDTVFLYLGDLTYRFATEEDNAEATKLMKSIPGIKVLILGNHDTFLGEQFYMDCGFSYVIERLDWGTYIFTHRPIRMDLYPEDYWNIHGHVHMVTKYNNSDGSKNINVYPGRFNNKPVTLKYLISHKEKLVKDNYYNDNNGLLGESAILNESMMFNKKDLYLNVDKFESGESNILLITGLSGSGKSTLAEQLSLRYHAEYIELDLFENVGMFQNDNQLKEAGGVFYEYFSKHPDLREQLSNREIKGKVLQKEITRFVQYALSFCRRNKNTKYILEGVQIYSYYQYLSIKGLPLIIKNTSALTSAIRRLKRSYQNGEIKKISDIKNLEIPQMISWYLGEEKAKKMFEKAIKANNESSVIYKEDEDPSYDVKLETCKAFSGNDPLETIINMEMMTEFTINDLMRGGTIKDGASHILELKRSEIPEEEFGVPQLRKYPLDSEAHVRSAIKFFNYVDKKYEKQLALKIKRKMKEYGIADIHISEKNRLSKYITEFCIESCDYLIRNLPIKHEYSMASMNPLQGIVKPCIMVASDSNTIPTKLYGFSPNLISSKYLVIDENCKLRLVDRSHINNMQVDVYHFSGDRDNVRKIYEAYQEQEVVSPSYIYECLSGRKMLSEDQLQYDPNFRKLDLNNLNQIDGFQNNIEEFKESVLKGHHDDIL